MAAAAAAAAPPRARAAAPAQRRAPPDTRVHRLERLLGEAVHAVLSAPPDDEHDDVGALVARRLLSASADVPAETLAGDLAAVCERSQVPAEAMRVEEDSPAWTLDVWLQSDDVSGQVTALIASAIRSVSLVGGPRKSSSLTKVAEKPTAKATSGVPDERRLCDAVGALDEARACAVIRYLLFTSSFVDDLVCMLSAKMADLASRSRMKRSPEASDKYMMRTDSIAELTFGGISTFFRGLEGFLGPPSGNLMDAMEWEHTECSDANKPFQAHNYGTTTTSKKEWYFVTDPTEGGLAKIESKTWPKEEKLLLQDSVRRKWADKSRGHPREAVPIEGFRHLLSMRNEQLRQEGENPIRKEEFFGARLYTGPMYLKYNATLRYQGMKLMGSQANSQAEAEFRDLCDNNKYVTTIHTINSAIVKLSKLTKVSKVYRGIANRRLPHCFLHHNKHNVRGGVEFAFMSTTPKMEIAQGYAASGARDAAIILEVQMGMVDRGADISWLSQYPHEQEILFAPLTSITVDALSTLHGVQLFKVNLNINLRALTLEQVSSKMQTSVLQLIDLLADDLRFAGVQERTVAPLKTLHFETALEDAASFNDASKYMTATQRVLDEQRAVFDELLNPQAWIIDPSASMSKSEDAMHEQAKQMRKVASLAAAAGRLECAKELFRMSFGGGAGDDEGEANSWQLDAIKMILDEMGVEGTNADVVLQILQDASQKQQHAFGMLLRGSELVTQRITIGAPVICIKLEKGTKIFQYGVAEGCADGEHWQVRMLVQSKDGKAEELIETLPFAQVLKVPQQSEIGVGSLLLAAASRGMVTLLELLLDAGVPIMSANYRWDTAISLAVQRAGELGQTHEAYQRQIQTIKMLVNRGANVHLFNKHRKNAFDYAVRTCDPHVLRAVNPSDVDIAIVTEEESTKLLKIAETGDVKRLCQLAEAGELDEHSVNATTKTWALCPLMVAARNGHAAVCKKLLELRADPTLRTSKDNCSALDMAVANGHPEVVQELVKYSKELLELPRGGKTPLFFAAQYGNIKMVLQLLKSGAGLESRNKNGHTPLMIACMYGHADVARELIVQQADICAEDKEEATALMLAARYGHAHIATLLLDKLPTAQIDKGDRHGFTSFMRAAAHGHVQFAGELLKFTSNVAAADKNGVTALMNACRNGWASTLSLILRRTPPAELSNVVDAADEKGESSLFKVAAVGHIEALRALLHFKADVNKARSDQTTPLMEACRLGHELVAHELLHAKADINAQRHKDGATALILAVQNNWEVIVRVLLQWSGLDVHQQDEDKKTALMYAHEKTSEKIVDLLSNSRTVLFQSMQQTTFANETMRTWLAGRMPESVKASLPPFNKKLLPPSFSLDTSTVPAEALNVPVFGLRIPNAIGQIFQREELSELAAELRLPIPQYDLSKVVQDKMFKVRVLIDAARELPECASGSNKAAIERLSEFVESFQKLKSRDIDSPEAWRQFVNRFADKGWEDRLHFDHVLSNFGFDDKVALRLRSQVHIEVDSKTGENVVQSLEQFSLRWLSKAFAGYNLKGCLTDVINLIFAMAGKKQRDQINETENLRMARKPPQIVSVVEETVSKIFTRNFAGLWIPTHYVHDAEVDDSLSWLLLEYVHLQLGTKLQVLIQLPDDKDFDILEEELCRPFRNKEEPLTSVARVRVFRDGDSTNQKALRDFYQERFPMLLQAKNKN